MNSSETFTKSGNNILFSLLEHNEMGPKLITPRSAAKALSCSVKTVYRLCHGGHLVSCKVGSSLRIDSDSLHKYIDRQIELFQIDGELSGNFETPSADR